MLMQNVFFPIIIMPIGIGATTVGSGGDWSPTFRLRKPTMYWSPKLLGCSFQKARNFTASIVVCSDIHVLGSPLISIVVTRMQDLASEFSQIFQG